MKKHTGGWCARYRRAAALALILLLCLQLLPGMARAAEGDEEKTAVVWETMDNSSNTASNGKRVSNTYILEVSSGTRQGGGVADNVLYFIIHYTTADGDQRTKILAPHVDALYKGFNAAAAAGNREERRQTVWDTFGYSTAPLNEKEALGSVATDQLMFTTADSVATFDKIQIFGKRNEEHGNWNCQGMRIYRVDTLYGLEMYGWYSDTGFIDFAGNLVTDVVMPAGGVTFRWSNSAGMYDITPSTLNAKLTMLPGTGTTVESQLKSRVVFRIDFADVAGAGFESLKGSYAAGKRTKISDLKFCETAAIKIRYMDTYGCVREVTLPVVVNALGQIMEVLGDAEIAEFAQQGDTIAMPAVLPFFARLESLNLTLGEEKATEEAHMVTGTVGKKDMSIVPVAGGVFTLSSKNAPNRYLSVNGSVAYGATLVTLTESKPSLQHWRLVDAGDGYYFIRNTTNESYVLDVPGHHFSNGSSIALYRPNSPDNNANQKWKLVDEGNGYYGIISAENSTFGINESPSRHVVITWTYTSQSNEIWRFTNVDPFVGEETVVSPNTAALNDPLRSGRVTQSKTDDISYLCVAMYQDVTVQVGLDGATLRTRFIGGTPADLSTATSADGVPMTADKTAAILMRKYAEGMSLIPRDRTERYLVTMTTDNVPNAGTTADIYLQFTYISVQNKELVSAEYRVRDYVREFYGEWPGNAEDFAYNYGLRDGGTIKFMIPLQGVEKFEKVSVRVKGEDEWQFTGIELAMVNPSDAKTGEKSYSPRLADWSDIAVTGLNNLPQGLYSSLVYSRDVETGKACFTVGEVYEEEEKRPDPTKEDSGWVPGSLVQDDGDTYVYDGETKEVTKKDDVPWEKLRHYMTYNDAMQDLGFTKERCVYTVSVQVAGKTVNAGNDDCGSKNLFYFRLIFENGNSGCTLANQQIVGDAFGTGELVQFKIPTSQDYGEVVAVQVIPDSQDSNSDIYDKLQIEEISVTRDTVDAVSPTWTAKIATASDEGWVGIDFREEGELASGSGAQGRSLSELATTFPITETSYSTNLLVSITTASYETGVQFSGGIGMELNFINAEGRTDPNPIRGFDVVDAMNDYGGLPGSQTRKYKVNGEVKTENVNYYVSDSRYQFLPGSTDSFMVTLKNVYQLTDMTLTVYSDVVTHWTISNVKIFQLKGEGIRYLNSNGAYDYRYMKGEEPTLIATWAPDRVTTPLGVYDAVQNDKIASISFALDSETIKLSEDATKWSSTITREPSSKNDTVNLFLYPSTANGAADPADYEVVAAVKYTDTYTQQALQVSTGQMRRGTDANGNTVFYALGLSASNLDAILGVDWSATILRSATPTISEGILQVVRGGVLIDSYTLTGAGYTMYTMAENKPMNTHRLLLQVSEDTLAQAVKADSSDLAVALYFRGTDPTRTEFRSKYIFLSDVYSGVNPGDVLELDFNMGNVSEITGINIVSMGKLDIKLDGAYLATEDSEGNISSVYGIATGISPVVTAIRSDFGDRVTLLNLHLKTAEETDGVTSGTKDHVRLNVGYYDSYGYAKTLTIEDLRLHTAAGEDAFASGAEDDVSLLIPDFSELRWIELEPWHDLKEGESVQWSGSGTEQNTNLSTWKLYSVTSSLGLNGREQIRVTDQRIVEGTPLRIGLSEIMLLGVVTHKTAAAAELDENAAEASVPFDEEAETSITITAGEIKPVSLVSGGEVKVSVRLSGSDEGFGISLQSVDPVTGELSRGTIDETHGYTQEQLLRMLSYAEDAAENAISEAERIAAREAAEAVKTLMSKTGMLKQEYGSNEFIFAPPRNYTGGKLIYRLTVTAKELPEAYFSLDLTVNSEENPLTAANEAWAEVRTAGVVTVLNSDGSTDETMSVLAGGAEQIFLPSGGQLEIVPQTFGENFSVTLKSVDPATNQLGRASLDDTHGYTQQELETIISQAEASAHSAMSETERTAARAAADAAKALLNAKGELDVDVENNKIGFTPPRNYAGGSLIYRLTVNSEEMPEISFNLDVYVSSEKDPLPQAMEAWNAVRTAGVARIVTDSGTAVDTVSIIAGGTQQILLSSGGQLEIVPHSSGSGADYQVTLRDLDPATGATGPASLGVTHGYTTERLQQAATEAYRIMYDGTSSQELRTAARDVLNAISEINATEGSFENSGSSASFTAPHNYTGGNMYYRITVTSGSTNELLFNVDVSVRAEANPLTEALSQLQTARNNALLEKQTAAAGGSAAAAGAAGSTGGTGDTGSAAGTGTAGDTGSAGSTGTAGDTGSAGGTGTTGDTGSAGGTGTAGGEG